MQVEIRFLAALVLVGPTTSVRLSVGGNDSGAAVLDASAQAAQRVDGLRSRSEPSQAIEPVLDESAWTQSIERALREQEYGWSSSADGACTAPNRAHGLRSRVDRTGIAVWSRDVESGSGAPWTLRLRTAALGRAGELQSLGEGTLAWSAERVEIRRETIHEWYVNDADGIEQGWTLLEPPAGAAESPLWIALEARGLEPQLTTDRRSAR